MSGEAGAARTVRSSLGTDQSPADDASLLFVPGRSARIRQQAQWLAFISADLLAFVMATLLVHLVAPVRHTTLWDWTVGELLDGRPEGHLIGLSLIFALLLGYFSSRGHYSERVPFWTEMREVVGGVAVALLCADIFLKAAVLHVNYTGQLAARWVLFAPLLLGYRSVASRLLDRFGLWQRNTLIVGPKDAAQRIIDALHSEPGLGYRVVGAIDFHDVRLRTLTSSEISSTDAVQGWSRLLCRYQANLLVFAGGCEDPKVGARLAFLAQRSQVPFALVPAIEPLPAAARKLHCFLSHDVTLLTFHSGLSSGISRRLKRGFDVLASLLLIVLISPLLLTIALLVQRDGGAALYRHKRIGVGGKAFPCLKFRTMHENADAVLKEILARDPAAAAEWAATQKLREDPRITPIGQVLRKTSLDELPQLFNVLRGEMSLVGPRPIVASEVGFYGIHIADYYEARPGITGLWQVSGRSDTSYPRRVQLDVWYVRNWSLWHDIAILLKTIPAVLQKRGAV